MSMPPLHPPPAPPTGADSRRPAARRALPPTSEERQLLAGCLALTIGGMLVLIVATFAFKSTVNIYLVGGGAILALLVLAFVLNRYALSPKPSAARRIADESPGWAIGQVGCIVVGLIGLWQVFSEANRHGWDIGTGIGLLTILGFIALAAGSLFLWVKVWRAGRDRSKGEP
jgi:hypothetical protein